MDEEENRAPKKKVRYDEHPNVSGTPKLGMMRHEIEHRFRSVWMVLKQKDIPCARCNKPLPSLKTAAKCQGKRNRFEELFIEYFKNATYMLTFLVLDELERLVA